VPVKCLLLTATIKPDHQFKIWFSNSQSGKIICNSGSILEKGRFHKEVEQRKIEIMAVSAANEGANL
jgi:hypothetical protein